MAVVAVNSTLITNINASPPVQNAPWAANSRERVTGAYATVTSGDSINSTYRLMTLNPLSRMVSLRLFNNAITSGAMNVGLHRTLADGGAAVAASAYASAISIATASLTGTELKFSARTIDQIVQQIWQIGRAHV